MEKIFLMPFNNNSHVKWLIAFEYFIASVERWQYALPSNYPHDNAQIWRKHPPINKPKKNHFWAQQIFCENIEVFQPFVNAHKIIVYIEKSVL